MTALAKKDATLAVRADQTAWTEVQQSMLASIGVAEAPKGDQLMLLQYAQRTGLDPFSQQLYMIGRNDKQSRGGKKWTIQASIDGLRIVAERSGKYRGQVGPQWCGEDGQWVDVWLQKAKPRAARVGVLRADFDQPLYAIALWDEYVQTTYNGSVTSMWASKGALMLAKCAEALALRKAFPNDLSGIYTSEEMSQADAPQAPQVVNGRRVTETVKADPATPNEDAPHEVFNVECDPETGEVIDAEIVEAPDTDEMADELSTWWALLDAADTKETVTKLWTDLADAGVVDEALKNAVIEKGTALAQQAAAEDAA